MTIKALARWATLVAALATPLAASADDQNKPSDQEKDTTKAPDTNKEKSANENMEKGKGKTAKAKLSDNEMQVLAHLHHVNQMEIEAGKIAQKKGTVQAVKQYGQTLVKDHQTMDKDLMSFAKKNDAKIGAEKATNETEQTEMKDQKDAMKKMESAKGAEFDREFLQQMVTDHERELAKIDSEVGMTSNSDLQTLLKDVKPQLQRHADQARDLQKAAPQASANPR